MLQSCYMKPWSFRMSSNAATWQVVSINRSFISSCGQSPDLTRLLSPDTRLTAPLKSWPTEVSTCQSPWNWICHMSGSVSMWRQYGSRFYYSRACCRGFPFVTTWWTSSLDQSEQSNLFLSLRHHIFQERSPLNTTQKTRELSPASRLSP